MIPAYNVAATLDKTLRSIRAQTYERLEIVVIDDGSVDDTVRNCSLSMHRRTLAYRSSSRRT